eukprot:CAMPEP_0205922698 /NCGR_PEP_ID=MMETSP1325-20131115/14910_1 /ASSEMBLY_ACC=CAM_ASM_000708 /TAXON_ID=236786 /ORGANISM="Florenciella sp., Strain RCC1007" /LENGTH=64 /DNA_ID=CAMNT_0053290759 /DNA_START=56 /DNA_END=247 /DNA_ORIENTATION=+
MTMGSLGALTTEQPRVGLCMLQKSSPSFGACFSSRPLGAQLSNAASDTSCGWAEQYGREPGLAR